MRVWHHLTLIGLLTLFPVACMPVGGSIPGGSAGQHAQADGTIHVSIRPYPGGMQAQALPKRLASVASYTVTLFNGANQQVASSGSLVNPQSGAALPASFTAVPAGSGYYVKVEAFDAGTASITQGGPTASSNTVSIANGVGTYSDGGTALTVTLALSSATAGTGSVAGGTAIGGPLSQFGAADTYGLALVNNATHQITPNALQAGTTFGLTGVQVGATTGATHEIWAFSGVTGTSLAAPAKPFPTGADGSGAIQPPTVTLAAAAITTPNTGLMKLDPAPAGPLTTDTDEDVFYWDGAAKIMKATPGGGTYVPSDWITGLTGTITLATDNAGKAFYSNGTNIMTQAAGVGPFAAGTSTVAVTAANVGAVAVDESGNLYWADTVANTIRKARALGGGLYAAPATVCTATGVTKVDVDAYGNVYFSETADAKVQEAVLGLDGYTYATPTIVVNRAVTSFDVDRPGNLYFIETNIVTDRVRMAPAGPSRATAFNVAGTGAETGVNNTTGVPTTVTLFNPNGLCVSSTGKVFFHSKGVGGTPVTGAGADDYLRIM